MAKEIVMDVTAAIIVLGSVFGFSHWMKLRAMIRKHRHSQAKEREPKIVQMPSPSTDKPRSA